MFEHYTDRARGCIYFARQSVSDYGSMTIETEHILLGILQEDANVISRFLPSKTSKDIRAEVEKGIVAKPKIPTNIDIPLSKEGARILSYAKEEAELLGNPNVGVEHILLSVVREEDGVAGH